MVFIGILVALLFIALVVVAIFGIPSKDGTCNHAFEAVYDRTETLPEYFKSTSVYPAAIDALKCKSVTYRGHVCKKCGLMVINVGADKNESK